MSISYLKSHISVNVLNIPLFTPDEHSHCTLMPGGNDSRQRERERRGVRWGGGGNRISEQFIDDPCA